MYRAGGGGDARWSKNFAFPLQLILYITFSGLAQWNSLSLAQQKQLTVKGATSDIYIYIYIYIQYIYHTIEQNFCAIFDKVYKINHHFN